MTYSHYDSRELGADLQAIDGRDGASGSSQELVVVALVALRVDLPQKTWPFGKKQKKKTSKEP